jgi:hypothetical protein
VARSATGGWIGASAHEQSMAANRNLGGCRKSRWTFAAMVTPNVDLDS